MTQTDISSRAELITDTMRNVDPTELDQQNFPGLHNRLIRYYFYVNQGLNILNNFRNLFLVIFAAYFALKLDNYWLLVGMFIPSIIGLMILGYYATHYMNKITDWLSLRFSTTYGIRQFNLTQGIYDTLQEIKNRLP